MASKNSILGGILSNLIVRFIPSTERK